MACRRRRIPTFLLYASAIVVLYLINKHRHNYEIQIVKRQTLPTEVEIGQVPNAILENNLDHEKDPDPPVPPPQLPQENILSEIITKEPAAAESNKIIYADVYSSDVVTIRKTVTEINFKGCIQNFETFPRDQMNDPVLVVQVHDRFKFLEMLLDSLRNVIGIEKALLIISSDIYSRDINNLVSAIDFCQVQHIFYPYSYLFFKDQFPGTDPNDCSRDLPMHEAIRIRCNNAEFPDSYNHYREANFVQLKHHWFWKLQFTFQTILPENTQSSVIILEDDYLVTPDLLQINNQILSENFDSNTDIISLGNYEKKLYQSLPLWSSNRFIYEKQSFYSPAHNLGMSINRAFFEKLHSCRKDFCTYDDYNWDWSIQSIIGKCPEMMKLETIVLVAPRVFHVGDCTGVQGGMHTHSNKQCDFQQMKSANEQYMNEAKRQIPGSHFTTQQKFTRRKQSIKPNGGWSDPRDHALCLDYNVLAKASN